MRAGISLSTVRLSSFGLRRQPPRAPADRQPGYERLFDSDTLFYDVFRGSSPGQVICLGPPLLDCTADLSKAVFRGPDQEAIAWEYQPPRSQYQPSCRFHLSCPSLARADRVRLELAGREVEIPIRASGHTRLAGRHVIWTLSKDNQLAWIRDWAAFNAAVHGADTVLFYDNGSSSYALEDVERVLKQVAGLAEVLTVPWDFPYGPGTGPNNVQDSFYCQPGALEHARRRLCGDARAVLNTDIDELTLLDNGGSVFERLESSGKAALVFGGYWVESVRGPEKSKQLVRHEDCLHAERWRSQLRRFLPGRWLLRTKWVVLPRLCPESVDWGIHDLHAAIPEGQRNNASWKMRPRDLFYRHFRQINTNWKRPPWRSRRYSLIRHRYDRLLDRALAAIRAARADEPPPPRS